MELDPHDPITLDLFGNMLVGRISMNQHEIPVGYSYSGNPQEDLALMDFYFRYLPNIESPDNRKQLESKLLDLKKVQLNT